MAQLTGKVAVFNIDGTIDLTGTGLLDTDEMINRSASLNSAAQTVDLPKAGVVQTRAYQNRTRSCQITVAPYDPDTPGSLSGHKAKLKLPVEGSLVTLADFASPDFNGDWNFESGSITPQDGGFLQMSFTLSRVGETSGVPAALTPQA